MSSIENTSNKARYIFLERRKYHLNSSKALLFIIVIILVDVCKNEFFDAIDFSVSIFLTFLTLGKVYIF